MLAVPTSAVETTGTRSYVLEPEKGELTPKVIKVGMVGDTYTQVLSGLSKGQSVVLADYAEAVPSSNTDLTDALGGGGGFGGGGFGGAGLRRRRHLPPAHQRRRRGRRVHGRRLSPRVDAAATPGGGRYGGDVAAIRLDQMNLVVHDVGASRAFYPASAFISVTSPTRSGTPTTSRPPRRGHASRRRSRQRDFRHQVEPGLVRRERGHPRLQGGDTGRGRRPGGLLGG